MASAAIVVSFMRPAEPPRARPDLPSLVPRAPKAPVHVNHITTERLTASSSSSDELSWPWLLAPTSPESYEAQHREKEPLLIERESPYYRGLQSGLEEVNEILARQRAAERDPELMHPSGGCE